MSNRIFTSESVTEGHPDKICDQISDAVLDAIIEKDNKARVACECIVTTGMALVMGEISADCYVDIPTIVRNTIGEIGYNDPSLGFDSRNCAVLTTIDEQSEDIALGVDNPLEFRSEKSEGDKGLGAGDQGMVFGYACDETPELMPAPISIAHKLARRLSDVRKSGELDFLCPDGKTMVSVEYRDNREVKRIASIVVSSQHTPDVSMDTLRDGIIEMVVNPSIDKGLIDDRTKIFINPTGRFVVGGPRGDSGLTGRKIIVDTYGGYSRHGGGAFSGKDPTKVDRSAAYMARYVAKNIVAAGLARQCEVEVAYAIGVAKPVSVLVETFGTGVIDEERLAQLVLDNFDLRPAAIINHLDLARPIYRQTAAYGHFGRSDVDLPWEHTDMAPILRDAVK
ncbi:MAG: methionine adenosyltransferase [Clostridiales bacterium]|nr:methionine adenosyltransferase [Clostridiales bacterium]